MTSLRSERDGLQDTLRRLSRKRSCFLSTPELHLSTLFVLNTEGRIISTREPHGTRGPLFSLVRSTSRCAWAVRHDVPNDIALALASLAKEESPSSNLQSTPVHAHQYVSLLRSRLADRDDTKISQYAGPAFVFPDSIIQPDDVEVIEDERLLHHHFRGWRSGEIKAGRAPVMAIIKDRLPVSICFCARSSDVAAEAGLETAEAFRGRGFGTRVTAAWALAIRASGRIPLYSTFWTNTASVAVARKLGLKMYASAWSVCDRYS